MHGTLTRPDPAPRRNPLVLRLALRELRGGLSGFGVFLACIALGVAAIAGIASVSRSLSDGLGREGRRIIGGDLSYSLVNREATPEERAVLAREGRLDVVASLRAMAVAPVGDAALVELKAVDPATYPAAGDLVTEPQAPLADLLAGTDGVPGALADPALLTRLDLKPGDRITLAGIRSPCAARSSPNPTRSRAASASGRA